MKNRLSLPVKIGIAICILQLALSIILVVKFAGMGFLPGKLLMLMAAVLVLMFGITFGLQFVKGLHWAGKVIAVAMIAILIFGLTYVFEADSTLNQVSKGPEIEKDRMVVVVKDDSGYQYLNDLAGKKIGVQYQMDVELMGKVVDECKERLDNNLEIVAHKNYISLYPELLSGKVDAMILNSSYLDIIDDFTLEESGERFSELIRVVEYFEFEMKKAEETEAVKETEPEHEFDITKDPFILYCSGIDTYGDISVKSRSDVNIMLVVNPVNRQILMVTTPRDSFVVIPGVSLDGKDKLTHAGIFGVDKSRETIESIYDIKIRYTMRVNFNSLISIVDALGGVDAYAAYDFQEFKKGMNHLNGEQALRFARERHAFADGDRQRGRDQVEIVRAVIKKCTTSTAILKSFPDLMNTISSQIQVSVPSEEIYAMVKMQLEDFREWELFAFDTKTTNGREYCYSYPWKSLSIGYLVESSVEQAKAAMNKIMNGEMLTATDIVQ